MAFRVEGGVVFAEEGDPQDSDESELVGIRLEGLEHRGALVVAGLLDSF